MPSITEFAAIKLKAPYTVYTDPLPNLLELVRKRQSNWSSYEFYYFTDINDDTTAYLITGWDSVPAHHEWIKSDGNQELLQLFEPYMESVSLRHLDMPFDQDIFQAKQIVYEHENEKTMGKEGPESGSPRREVVWTGRAIDLEDPDSGYHHLTIFSRAWEEGSEVNKNRIILKRLDRME